MRRVVTTIATVMVVLLSATTAHASSFDFVGVSTILFSGTGTFSFPDGATGDDILVVNGPAGFLGDFGNIGGTFTIGAISSCGAGCQTAPVTGLGSFSLDDGSGAVFSADLSWLSISTLGTSGSLNTLGSVNLSNFSYTGTDPDYLSFFSALTGVGTLSFQLAAQTSLTSLTTQAHRTSYSGSVTSSPVPVPVPEPASIALLGTGLLGLAAGYRRRARSRK